jgi:tetratricopeptide (TPR) repeat protein
VGPPLADGSALLTSLSTLARQGRFHDVIDRVRSLAPDIAGHRAPFALLAAEMYGRLGEHDTADEWAGRALDLARRSLDRPAELRAAHLRGAIAWQRGAVEAAEEHFQHALELARTLHDAEVEARAFNNIGILQHLRVAPEAGLANFQVALAAYQQAGNARGMAETHHNMAISWRVLGNGARASDAADEAVRLARQVDDPTLLGLTLIGRAEAHLVLGDASLASVELDQAAAAYDSVHFAAGVPEVKRVQAAVARARSDPSAAKTLLLEATELGRLGAPLHTQAEIARDLGETLSVLADRTEARAAWARALALFERLGASRDAAALKALLAER